VYARVGELMKGYRYLVVMVASFLFMFSLVICAVTPAEAYLIK
jgi:hypothetical protein